MSYTTLSGTGDNLPRINEWRSLHQSLPSNLKLTSTIMMTSLSSAVSQASQQNAAQVQKNFDRYNQEYPKLSGSRASNRTVASIINVFDEMHGRAKQLVGMHLGRSADDQAKYNVGVKGAQTSFTGKAVTGADAASIDASVTRAEQPISLSIPAAPAEKSKMLIMAVLGLIAVGGLIVFLRNR